MRSIFPIQFLRGSVLVVGLAGMLLAADAPKSTPAKPARKGEPTTRTQLPQDHEYQRTLRQFLATLTEKDFTHGVAAPVAPAAASTDPEYLYRNYLLTLMNQPLIGTKRGTPAINAPARLFLLSHIESASGVQQLPVWPETLMTFVTWDYPGNPYRDNRALKLRAFASATVMMIMLDDFLEQKPEFGRGDWFSYQLVYFGLPYLAFKDVLPPNVQKAYEAGLRRMGERVLGWGIRGEEPHTDVIAPFGLHCAARALGDPDFTKRVEEYARTLYTDPRYFNPNGYWVHRGGIDVPFNGQANYFAAATALATDWPFVRDALERIYRLRGHLILREPDGTLTGPSHFNSRVSGPASIDQWAWNGARDAAAAMITDEAAHVVAMPSPEALRDAPARRASQFANDIRENPVNGKGGFLTNDEIPTYPWKWRVWTTFNFPASVNPGYEFYRPGAYARRHDLEKKNSPLLKSPFERGESFVRAFGKDFVVVRQPTFAAILHTGPIGTQHPGEKMHQFAGPLGLSGGQLSAFWTPATGTVLLGQRGGMTYDKSFDQVEAWRTWPNHSVSGSTVEGVFFTSARVQKPDVRIEADANRATVAVTGPIPATVVGQEKAIAGKYDYARTFRIDGNGVQVETTVSGDGGDAVAELYEVLPIYLRESSVQAKVAPTAIEWQVNGKWHPASEQYTEGVQAVRLTRFTGAAQITFDKPRRVKLSPVEWGDTFLSRGAARNVLVDLLASENRPAKVRQPRTVRYTIAPSAR